MKLRNNWRFLKGRQGFMIRKMDPPRYEPDKKWYELIHKDDKSFMDISAVFTLEEIYIVSELFEELKKAESERK